MKNAEDQDTNVNISNKSGEFGTFFKNIWYSIKANALIVIMYILIVVEFIEILYLYCKLHDINLFKKKEVVFENVPLCGFDKVYEIVEKYVDEGKIKRVYNISLGYIIYLDKKEEYSDKKEKNGKQRDYADYLLIPTWIIGCSYSENGSNDDQTDMNSYDGSEQQDLNYQKIFIDAQTGKLHDPKEVGSERYYADVN